MQTFTSLHLIFTCAGKVETFYTPKRPGTYRIQCWGAQGGGNSSYPGGKGAYTKGDLTLTQGENLYVCVGRNGNYGANSSSLVLYGGQLYRSTYEIFNNGCPNFYNGYQDATGYAGWCYAGGGSTDIRLDNGNGDWTDFNSRKSRIMVAASGGGSKLYYYAQPATDAGGLTGYPGLSRAASTASGSGVASTAATQTSRGKNGTGSNVGADSNKRFGIIIWTPNSLGGAGNGYYAGGDGNHGGGTVGTGSTGSCFISGYTGCNAISASSTETNIIHTGQPNHYSGKVFTNTQMLDGKKSMPSPNGSPETGHTSDGACIITQISFN